MMKKMKYTKKLFKHKNPYDLEGTDALFVQAMRENAVFQYQNCADYRRILDEFDFCPEKICSMEDLVRLPFLPTLYFKHHHLQSVPPGKQLIKATSSGTRGSMSKIGFDFHTLSLGLDMVIRVGKYHRLWSATPVNYIIFGYQPTAGNQTAVSKTAYGFTFFAPALSRTFALEMTDSGYKLSWDRVLRAFERCSVSRFPLRTMGFPSYTYFLLKEMESRGLAYSMPKGSMVAVGGGWKQFYSQQVDKHEFYRLVKKILDIDEENVIEFFGAVEHPILYTDCSHHHFHVPIYSRVIIRNPDDFSPLENGKPGLVNLLTPMIQGAPLLSIMTDDLGILHSEKCPCQTASPWLEIVGRVGISDIITCAAGAEKYLKE